MHKRDRDRNDFSGVERYTTNALLAKELRDLGFRVENRDGLIVSTREGRTTYGLESETDFNGQISGRIVKNKAWTRRLLTEAGINMARGDVFALDQKEAARKLLRRLAPGVVKPQDGNRARGVTVNVTEDGFDAAWDLAARETRLGIVVEEYFSLGEEARYFVLDGKCIGVYRRLPPHVIGDGKSSVRQLVDRTNRAKAKNPYRRNAKILLSDHQLKILYSQGLTLNSVPDDGALIAFDQRAASFGRDTINVTNDVHPSMLELAERIAAQLPGLHILGVDIMARDHEKPVSATNHILMEINTRPHIRGHQFPDFGPPINVARMIAESCTRKLGFELPETSDPELPPPVPARSAATTRGRVDGITLVFGGDTSLGESYVARQDQDGPKQRLACNPESFFERLTPLISDKSHLILNLETVLADMPDDQFSGRKKHLNHDNPDRTLSVLNGIGVDAVSLANNHTMDFGPDCLLRMIDGLNGAGIAPFGAGHDWRESAKPLTLATPLGNVHIVAGFEFRANYHRDYGFYSGRDRAGVQRFRHRPDNQMARQISLLRNADPDAMIVAFPHWGGAQNYAWATDEMFDLNTSFLKAGADLVLGHGAHMIQQCWVDDRDTSVFSLGNFVFNSPGRFRQLKAPPFGLVARLNLQRRTGKWAADLRLYPIVTDNLVTDYQTRPVTESEAIEVYRILESRGQRCFRDHFALDRDARGWFLTRTGPLNRNTVTLD